MKLQILRRTADFSLFAGIFLTLLGFGTFGWESLQGGGYALLNGIIDITFIQNSILIVGLALICESLLVMQFGFATGERKLPSKDIMIGFMFIMGLFLFISGLAIISPFFGDFYQIETGYAYSLVGLGLFGTSMFLWDKERKMKTQVNGRLRWEIVSSFSIAVILFDLFIANNGGLSIPVQMIGFGPFVLLVLFTVWLIVGISRIVTLKEMPSTLVTAAPLKNSNVSSYIIVGMIITLGFLFVPLIPVTVYCDHQIVTGLYILANDSAFSTVC